MSRPVSEQVVVITGASSGIGRETALQFGAKGASVVLAARSQSALEDAARQIERLGGKAHVVVTDVADWSQVSRLVEQAVQRFGRIDTWINNAAVAEYATVDEMSVEEINRIIQVILLGQIYGMKAVLPVMQGQREGTIINVASALATRSLPLQSAYCAAKHGIKGFTEALRLEQEHQKSGVKITLVMPASFNTPLFNHARSKMRVKPQPIPPIYDPCVAAEALLFLAEHPRRDVVVGDAAVLLRVLQRVSPALVDWWMLRNEVGFKSQMTDQPADGRDNLFEPMEGMGATSGDFGDRSRASSWYTRHVELYPGRQRVLAGLLALGILTTLSGGMAWLSRVLSPTERRI